MTTTNNTPNTDATTDELIAWADVVLLSTSGGKDSQAMIDLVAERANALGAADKMVAVHADLGRVEWEGTRELTERQVAHYGIRLEIVQRSQDLIDQVLQRGMWPSNKTRFCTSDHKRDQITKLMTRLAKEWKAANPNAGRPCRILDCMGIRAAESSARSKKPVTAVDKRKSTKTTRTVVSHFPIFDYSVEDVWARINASGVEHHRAYDLGMPRLSCVFCIFGSKSALMLAGKHNRELLDLYVETERAIGHTFKNNEKIEDIRNALDRGEEVPAVVTFESGL